jgi:hypothetical protein
VSNTLSASTQPSPVRVQPEQEKLSGHWRAEYSLFFCSWWTTLQTPVFFLLYYFLLMYVPQITDMNLGQANRLPWRAPTFDLWLEITKSTKLGIHGFIWITKVATSNSYLIANQDCTSARKRFAYHSVKLPFSQARFTGKR